MDRWTDKHIDSPRHADKGGGTDGKTDNQTLKKRKIDSLTQRDGQRDKQTDRQTVRQRGR